MPKPRSRPRPDVAQLQTLAEELTGATERREQDKRTCGQERELRAIDGNATAAAKAEARLLVAKIRDEARPTSPSR